MWKKLLITCIINYQIPLTTWLKALLTRACGLALFPYRLCLESRSPAPARLSASSYTFHGSAYGPHPPITTLPPYPSIQYNLPVRWKILFELSLFGAFTETTYDITSYYTAVFFVNGLYLGVSEIQNNNISLHKIT